MFVIVNQENSIIAADADFLKEISADDIYEAAVLIKKGDVVIDELAESISYFQKSSNFSKTELSTFLGRATLYEINREDEQSTEESHDDALFNLAMPQEILLHETENEKQLDTVEEYVDLHEETNEEEIFSLVETSEVPSMEDAPLQFLEEDETVNNQSEAIPDDLHISASIESDTNRASDKSNVLPQEILGFVDTDIETAYESEKPEVPEEIEEGIDLLIDNDPLISTEESKGEMLPDFDDISPILLPEAEVLATEDLKEDSKDFEHKIEGTTPKGNTNFQEISKIIGVSEEEYLHFLEDFKKESLHLESNLRSNDLGESREALSILREASLLLHLPQITEKLNILANATSDEKSSAIDSYLDTVMKIGNDEESKTPAFGLEIKDNPSDENEAQKETTPPTQEAPKEIVTKQPTISLDEIQAIPFDFSINEAADELTLPASLVSEFVVDFINQAKENLPVLQKAYEDKDLNTIQTTAHMLKGASSNLRIVPMAETLYELQFNEDLPRVPELIALFSGQLKALSLQMDQE